MKPWLDCQRELSSLDGRMFLCGIATERAGIRHAVSMHICQQCHGQNKELIEKLCENATKAREQRKHTPKARRPGLISADTITNFGHAVVRYVRNRGREVPERIYQERLICCEACGSKDGRCIYCGCYLKGKYFAKARWASEVGCPTRQTYQGLRSYPARNYWEVCGELTSVIIMARHEELLNQTLENLLATATGPVEILVGLDGWETDVLSDKRVKVVKFNQTIGRRCGINNLAAAAKGKYLFHCDAHCKFEEVGWDTKLKCACFERTITVATLAPLDGDKFSILPGARYQYSFIRPGLETYFWFRYHGDNPEVNVQQTLAFQGCAWMLRTADFWRWGGCDERFGEWGHFGTEWSLKAWLHPESPGQIVVRKDVVCGHLMRHRSADYPYRRKFDRRKVSKLLGKQYAGRVKKLIRQFAPVPNWPHLKPYQPPTIVTCVDDAAPKAVMDFSGALLHNVPGVNITRVRKPDNQKRGIRTMYEQLLVGLEEAKADYVFVCEQDVLYHPDHFRIDHARDDTFYYDRNYKRLNKHGYFGGEGYLLSMLSGNRQLIIRAVKQRLDWLKQGRRMDRVEFGVGLPVLMGTRTEEYRADYPSIDVRHGSNFAGSAYRHARRTGYSQQCPHWGQAAELLQRLGVDTWGTDG